ncbi:MAG: hypothetical protein QM755_24460 [Luteolibacter sp.]
MALRWMRGVGMLLNLMAVAWIMGGIPIVVVTDLLEKIGLYWLDVVAGAAAICWGMAQFIYVTSAGIERAHRRMARGLPDHVPDLRWELLGKRALALAVDYGLILALIFAAGAIFEATKGRDWWWNAVMAVLHFAGVGALHRRYHELSKRIDS